MKVMMGVMAMALLAVAAGRAEAAPRKPSPRVSGVINLNSATASQLDLLPGVGDKQAKAIVAYRQKQPFARPEEVVKVKGFGKKKFDRLKPHLTVSGATTLAVAPGLPSAEPATPQGRPSARR